MTFMISLLGLCAGVFSPRQYIFSFLTTHPLSSPLTSAKLGLLCGRALRQADLSRMWPHKRAQSECNELSAHYTDLNTFDMSSGSQR